jgi:hypothetical protein
MTNESKPFAEPNMKTWSKLTAVLPLLGTLTLLISLILGGVGIILTLLLGCAVPMGMEILFRFRSSRSKLFSPYTSMLFSPLLLLHYASITDFTIRITGFILFCYIFTYPFTASRREFKFSLENAKPLTIWLIAFLIFATASVAVTVRGVQLSGDEPHYLMIAQSLVEDGDFDLKNNIDNKTYFNFLPIEIRFHGGEYNGKYYSFHLPGLSFLLVPFYWIFSALNLGAVISPALFFRLVASLFNAFFGLCLFYLLKMKFPVKLFGENIGRRITGFWLAMVVLYPVLFHGIHLFPELPAATLMMAGYLCVFSEKKHYLWAGLFLSSIPWFHIKYLPALGVLGLAVLYQMFKTDSSNTTGVGFVGFNPFHKDKIKDFLLLSAFPVVICALLVIYSKSLYGAYSPTNIFPRESYWSVPWMLRLKVFLAYFLDQRDGLLFYCPLFFTLLFSFRNIRKLQRGYLLAGIGFAYVFFHAFTTVRGAYAPAGRPLMFVAWIFILFIAHFYFNLYGSAGIPKSFKILSGFSVFVLIWLFYYPLFVYQPVFSGTVERASGLNLFLGGDVVPMWKFFPSFLTNPASGHPANVLWLGLLVLVLVVYYLKPAVRVKKAFTFKPVPAAAITFILFLGAVYLYSFYPHVHLIARNKHIGEDIVFYNNSKNFRYLEQQKGFRLKAGNDYDIYIDRKMIRRDRLTFRFTLSQAGAQSNNHVILRNGKTLLFDSRHSADNSVNLRLSTLKTLKVGDKDVIHLGFETRTSGKDAFIWLEIK